MINRVKLICFCLDKATKKEIIIPGLELHLNSKEVKHKQEILIKFHNYNKSKNDSYRYQCTCENQPTLFVTRTPKGRYILKNQHVNQHSASCPLKETVIQTDTNGEKIGLKNTMFKMPSSRKKPQSVNLLNPTIDQYKLVNKQDESSTFNGLMSTVIDLACCVFNSKFDKFNADDFLKVIQNQMFNMPYGRNSNLSEYQQKLKDKGDSLYFENIFIDDILIKPQKNAPSSLAMDIDSSLESNLKQNLKRFFQINESVKGVRGDVLLKALQVLKIHNNYISGPYIITVFKIKRKSDQYSELPILHICPVMISNKRIVPVESNLERKCIKYISNIADNLYKPTSLDKNIYWNQLLSFLHEHDDEKKDIQNAYKLTKGDGKPFIRPDLFFIYNDQVYILEITGMLSDAIYKNRIEEKEDRLYSHLKKVNYIKASSVVELKGLLN